MRMADRRDWFENWLHGLRWHLGAHVYFSCRCRKLVAPCDSALFYGGFRSTATLTNAKTIGEWFPKSERPVAAGWAGVGFSIGAMLAPPIIYFAHASFGWQGAFMFTGVLALVWVVLWWAFYHNPEQHPNLSKDELDFIKQDNEPPAVKLPFLTALKTVSKNKRFYGIAIPAFMAEPAWAVLSFWVPLYLAKEHGMDLKQIAMFAWLPFLPPISAAWRVAT